MNTGLSPAFAYLRQPTMVDFPGRLAAVVFVAGCNFRCGFCHNASLMGRPRPGLSWDKLEAAVRAFKKNWVTGVAITGGEPTLDPGMPDLVRFFKERGWAVKLDTNGTNPERLRDLAPLLDSVAMDVKASLEAYPELTGWPDPTPIRESLEIVKGMGEKGLLRTTILDPFHTDAMMHAIGRLIAGAAAYQMQAFVPRDDLPDPGFRTLARTTPERLAALQALMRPYAKTIMIRGG